MKTLSLLLVGCLTALSVFAQDLSTVSITVKGTRNQQVWVDGQSYAVNNDINSVNNNSKTPITITGLLPGQHTLQVIRTNQVRNNATSTTTFTLRSGYDMKITINNNGSVSLSEVRKKRNWGNNSQQPMSN